jgi:hypothetical protein
VRQPAPDGHLLLVAARKALHLALRAGVDLQPLDASATRSRFSWRRRKGPQLRRRAEKGVAMFSRTERSRNSASARLPGTKLSPAAMASAGWRETGGRAVDLDRCRRRFAEARQHLEQLVLPLAFQRDDAQHLAGMQVETRIGQLGRGGEVLDRSGAGARRAGARGLRRRLPRSIFAPSIISTSRSSTPGAISASPTLRPSRRTVARSHSSAISVKRWEM